MLNLLVTGGYGFIGSNFINCVFPKKKYKIINVDSMNYCSNEENVNILIRTDPNYIFYKANINDKKQIRLH